MKRIEGSDNSENGGFAGKPTGNKTPVSNNRLGNNNQSDQGSSTTGGSASSVSLPKGGGAIRGMGEKFTVNAVTGTGSFS
ncbi:MAG: hypothetical protein WCM76_16665, partial [Bacteroidota bacterium]